MRFSLSASAALLGMTVWVAPAHAALSFGDFVTGAALDAAVGQNATIGFAYAGNKFVGSVYYGTNNNRLYSTDLSGGSVQTFGNPIPGFSGEIYVSASLGLGGYGSRDVFAGSQVGDSIYRISNDGTTQSLFAGAGIVGGVRSIAFDPYGLYGNQMVVATNSGNIYTVNNAGAATLLASVGEDAEGLSFAPQAFGTFAQGTLFVASENSGTVRAITPGGVKTDAITGIGGAEMVSFVPLNLGSSGSPVEGFYAAAYPNNIQKAGASQFAPYLGDAVITSETGHGVFDVHYNGSSFTVTNIGTFPAQPEDGIFVTADVIQPPVPEPETYALMLAGLGAMGWFARRRKRASKAL
ncbi:MAG: PEP-CTERM sorting domain-containing protein [Caldimonas sp.]|nr:PEP-CTERM sorting domain-containing protein [Pseudomonadota bacterium]